MQAIVFDFDGVLVESVAVKTRAFARLFAGEPPDVVRRVVELHLRHGGLSRVEKLQAMYREILRRPLDEQQLQSLCEAFASLVVEEVVAAPWVEGAQAFVVRACGRCPLFVVSGTPEEELRQIIRRRAMERYFVGVFGSPRPKDVLLQACMQQARLRPDELVFIGDSQTDWCAARETGVPFIWRRASKNMPALEGFVGPQISSLAQLESCLFTLMATGTLHGSCR